MLFYNWMMENRIEELERKELYWLRRSKKSITKKGLKFCVEMAYKYRKAMEY